MVGLGGLEPPTSPLSVLRPRVSKRHSSQYRAARQSKADSLERVAGRKGRGTSKEQQALASLGAQAERTRFQDGILEVCLDIRVRGGERLGHFSGPFRATPFPLVEDLRTVLAVKGSLRRATPAGPCPLRAVLREHPLPRGKAAEGKVTRPPL